MDMVVGGIDTTSNTVEFALAEMMKKPQVLRKAQQEVETVVGKDNIVEESHIHKLPYLYAVMKETLRLHPALPLLVPHCPTESCIVRGYTVPKGARVFVNVWAVHRDLSVWKNPLEFDPERFLGDSKWDYSGNDFNYFPFGPGRRICAGTAMAERMFMFSLASLVHSFDWKLPEGEKLDLEEKFGIVLKKKVPLVAIPTPRLSDPVLYEVGSQGGNRLQASTDYDCHSQGRISFRTDVAFVSGTGLKDSRLKERLSSLTVCTRKQAACWYCLTRKTAELDLRGNGRVKLLTLLKEVSFVVQSFSREGVEIRWVCCDQDFKSIGNVMMSMSLTRTQHNGTIFLTTYLTN
ncbi:unnamed protein product [Camellia sinensis]